MTTETWKVIEGFNGRYEVSNYGNVRSTNFMRTGRTQNFRPSINKKGYVNVAFWYEGKRHYLGVHRLVAEAFIPNPNNYPCVNHKDENPSNNNVDNLEWCSYQYNSTYGTARARMAKALSETRKNKHWICRNKITYQYDLSGKFIRSFISCSEAARELGCSPVYVSQCCLGKRKTLNGFIFSYKEL